MTEHQCPHCHTQVPDGASVCRGCQAELQYGPPPGLVGATIVIPILIGIFSDTGNFGFFLGIAVAAAGAIFLKRKMKDRVVFRRRYRTR